MYDQYKQFEKGRRCNSLKNNNPYEAGNEFEDEKLYSKKETGDLSNHPRRHTKASVLLQESTYLKTDKWLDKNFIRGRNMNPKYDKVKSKVNDKRDFYPPEPLDKSHMYFNGVDNEYEQYKETQLRRSQTEENSSENITKLVPRSEIKRDATPRASKGAMRATTPMRANTPARGNSV